MSSSNIGKNTVYLYFRSFVTLLISLFTSRVVLDKLGVDDYGLYNTVGSITAFLSFLTSSLALATSRYITYALGCSNNNKLKETFGTVVALYLILAILIVIILESVGPWFINNKIIYDSSRASAVNWVFHISIITVVLSMLSGPFNTLVIAHEHMGFFAYVSVFEAVAKLAICYMLTFTSFDRLIVYALMILAVHCVILLIYYIFCKTNYKEMIIRPHIHIETLKEIGGFAGWSLFGRFTAVLQMQGINIITNMFFGPAVVAARAISIQVNSAFNSFISNFMTAVQPQIVKREAAGDEESSNHLIQKSTVVSFVLATLICFPFILNSQFVLDLWLKDVPQYAVVFVQLILVQSVFGTIENGMYSIFLKKGRVKENALISPLLSLIMFVIVYILFLHGYSPVSLSYCYLANVIISCLMVKPYLIYRLFHYKVSFFIHLFLPCLKLIVFLMPVVIFHFLVVNDVTVWVFILESLLCILYLLVVSFFFIIDEETRSTLLSIFTKTINGRQTR